ncbi:hypothetical protein AWRI1631_31170 [Saccharomyces cerevisiae AWRI1631]|uniref:Uncharacterized protein n=1 Tax=Saccharomyces cerevisiae (strain AWRI1631) TaxID=545124 RepID=B5VF02_YEAS6|nr:hypothetical protein AWRI1631_31170 [Saccharomyces cerevisiae AWRI1631]
MAWYEFKIWYYKQYSSSKKEILLKEVPVYLKQLTPR